MVSPKGTAIASILITAFSASVTFAADSTSTPKVAIPSLLDNAEMLRAMQPTNPYTRFKTWNPAQGRRPVGDMAATSAPGAAVSAAAQSAPDVANAGDHHTVATVNGATINKGRVDLLIKQRAGMGQPDSPEMRKAIIDQLVMQLLVSQEAIKTGLDKTPEVIDQVELTKQSILANAFVQDYIKSHPVGDDMLKAEYDKVKAQMTGTEYKARHILVGSEAEGKDIIATLKKNPKAFDALAKEKSKDPGSKDKGGELGWFDPRGMVPEFGAAVTTLGKGKMTDEPVKTQFGYHVIVMEDSRPMQIPPLDQVKPQLTLKVQQEQLKRAIDNMTAKAQIAIAPPGSMIEVTANGTPISKGRVDLLVKQRAGIGQPDSLEMRKSIRDQLVTQLLVSQEAIKMGLDKTPEVIDQVALTWQSILASAFIRDYTKNHLAGDDKQLQQPQLKTLLDDIKAKAKIVFLN